MAASTDLLAVMATAGAAAINYAGLVNGSGVELSGGGYARIAVDATATGATIRLNADHEFTVPAGAVVAGWRAYSAATAGTNYGGGPLTSETYAGAGSYILEGADTGFTVTATPDA